MKHQTNHFIFGYCQNSPGIGMLLLVMIAIIFGLFFSWKDLEFFDFLWTSYYRMPRLSFKIEKDQFCSFQEQFLGDD